MQGVVVSVNESNLIHFLPSDSSVFNQSVNSLLRWPTAEVCLRLCRSVSCLEETQLSHHCFFLSISMNCFFPICSQPGKLAEAFKYFVQGMGYSKCQHSTALVVSE